MALILIKIWCLQISTSHSLYWLRSFFLCLKILYCFLISQIINFKFLAKGCQTLRKASPTSLSRISFQTFPPTLSLSAAPFRKPGAPVMRCNLPHAAPPHCVGTCWANVWLLHSLFGEISWHGMTLNGNYSNAKKIFSSFNVSASIREGFLLSHQRASFMPSPLKSRHSNPTFPARPSFVNLAG